MPKKPPYVTDSVPNQQSFPAISYAMKPSLVNTSRMGLIKGNPDSAGIDKNDWFDALDPAVLGMIMDSDAVWVYKGEPITTIAQECYGTTSLWYVILMYNGIRHPDQIGYGDILRIPSVSSTKSAALPQGNRQGSLSYIGN